MALLNANKQTLLNQVKRQPQIEISQLVKLIQTYDDLSLTDFRGYISDIMYSQLEDASRDPRETELWNRVISAPHYTPEEIQDAQRLVSTYMQQYPNGSKAAEAQRMMGDLQREIAEALQRKQREAEAAREVNDWEALERGNYNALNTYRMKYPNSVHMSELDDLMWENTKIVMSMHALNRYLNDWPLGNHAAEANAALSSFGEWESIKRSGDLFLVDDYRDNHPDSAFIHEINALYFQLRDEELKKMKANPSEYSKDTIEQYINADIFKQWELQDEGLITEESWKTLQIDRALFPNIQDYQIEDPNIQAPTDCTDIYLFGTPGTGKTCLLMGLAGAIGRHFLPAVPNTKTVDVSYTLNMKTAGGPYASALQQYVNAGITPGRTFGKFVTTINGSINETSNNGKVQNHKINLVEMSGEEFAIRIADGKDVTLEDMGTGATNLLCNDNRKVFFIIVDATKDMTKVDYLEQVKDSEGNIIDEKVRKKYISQLDILGKFVSLFELPENRSVMQKVDAIHFVVTKADVLGNASVRKEKARELLQQRYIGPVEQLKSYCRQTKRINLSTNYHPQVFTFSLGKFYLGDVFDFDPTETMQIVNSICSVTGSTREETWLDKLKRTIG